MEELENKTAVVTGSASGIGRQMALAFARERMQLVIADRRLDLAENVAQEIRGGGGRAVAIEVDVTSRESVEKLEQRVTAELGPTHILCNNAGIVARTPLVEHDEANWRWIVEVNLFGVVYCLQTFLPAMLAHGEPAHVVNTASVSGLWAGITGGTSATPEGARRIQTGYGYTATKYAVVGITEALRAELDGTNVGASVLCPGAHYTDIFDNSARNRPNEFGGPAKPPGAIREQIAKGTVLDVGLKDPAEAAARVVAGVRANELYIITHPADRHMIEKRFSRLLAAYAHAAAFGPWPRPE